MRTKLCLLVAACMSPGMASAAALTQIGAGMIYGGAAQTTAVCYFFNDGPNGHTVTGVQIIDLFGTAQNLTAQNCGSQMDPGGNCGAAATIAGNDAYACRGTVDGTITQVRGILEVRDGSQTTLANMQLR